MKRLTVSCLLAMLAAPAALADAIPPPEDLSDLQLSLIGTWQEDSCVMPQGLGHACLQRIYVFGNETFSEAQFSDMRISNIWSSSSRDGTWTAARGDGSTVKVTVTFQNKATAELTLALESKTAFKLLSTSDYTMFPESHFTRLGNPVTPSQR